MELFSLTGVALLLALGVTFLNGFTDAPNSIATAVATKALSMNLACLLSAVCNLLGLLISLYANMSVAESVLAGASLGEKREIGIIVILLTTIIFAVACWIFSMPSSESHALLASLFGASMALSSTISLAPTFKILIYMVISCVISFLLSCITYKMLKKANLPWRGLQIASCALSSAMHGAQDGQKLVALLLFLYPVNTRQTLVASSLAVGVALFLGTLLGGGRIVKTMGQGIVDLTQKSAFVSEISSSVCLIFCSSLGMPVSTSNIKACSVAGAGFLDGKSVCYKTLIKMAYVAILTFPICIALSYLITRALA